jgi:hypothetical protein
MDYNRRVSEADLQALLDGASADLGAAVSLEDISFRLLAHTAHGGKIDEARHKMLVGRRASPELRSWFEQWGIREAHDPVRTPADPAVGVEYPRWCVPVRFRNLLLGYVWVLDIDGIPPGELSSVTEAVGQIGPLLYRRRLLAQVDQDVLRLLLTPSDENASVAAEAEALGAFSHRGPVAVVVAGSPHTAELDESTVSDLALVIHRAAEQTPASGTLGGVISGLGVLLASLKSPVDLAPARRLSEAVYRLAAGVSDDFKIIVAIGGGSVLEEASHSYAEARRTLGVIRTMPDLGPIAAWDELGVFKALALLPPAEIENGALDSRVRRLVAYHGLAATAELFLDLAGNVQETSARLFVHRTTLYQRLDRIKALYDLDLRNSGEHRLLAHLGLKLAHLASGRLPASASTSG